MQLVTDKKLSVCSLLSTSLASCITNHELVVKRLVYALKLKSGLLKLKSESYDV